MPLFRRHRVDPAPPRPAPQSTAEVRGATSILELGAPPPPSPTVTPPDWNRSEAWLSWEAPLNAVRGESYFQGALAAFAGEPPEAGYLLPVPVDLIREPSNPHDGNAIRAELGGALVGHVARELAALFAPRLDAAGCTRLTVPGLIRGGSVSAPSIGVHLWLGRRLSESPELRVPEDLAGGLRVAWPPTEALAGDDSGDSVIDEFHHLERRMERAWSARDCGQVAMLAKRSMALLPGYLERRTSDVHELSALKVGGPVLAAFGDRDTLLALRAVVGANPRTRGLVPEADAALAAEALTAAIVAHVQANPGTVQKDLYRTALGADKDAAGKACYMAHAVGRLERVKSGTSYLLHVP